MKLYRKPPSRIEKRFTVVALLLFTSAFLPLLRDSRNAELNVNRGDPISQAVFFAIYFVTFSILLLYLPLVWNISKRRKIIYILLGFTILSIFWSSVPSITLRRIVALCGTTVFGIYLAVRYSLKQQMNLLLIAICLAAIFSIIVAMFFETDDNLGVWFHG